MKMKDVSIIAAMVVLALLGIYFSIARYGVCRDAGFSILLCIGV